MAAPRVAPFSTYGQRLRRARQTRGWSQLQLAYVMCRKGSRCDAAVPQPRSLKIMISRWENGHQLPDARSRRLLHLALPAMVAVPTNSRE